MKIRTSLSHPLQIATVRPAANFGLLGLSLCPGKTQTHAMTGAWKRDMATDLDAIRTWGASVVLSLVESYELEALAVSDIEEQCHARNLAWIHLPIRDRSVPNAEFERAWREVGAALRARLRAGFGVFVHCMGGLGRAGMISARLLVELGWDPQTAIEQIRTVRPGAIETREQERHVMSACAITNPAPEFLTAALLNRAKGALVGLACGDAVGTTLEFKRRDSYAPLVDMVGGGPFRLNPGEWTDDTAMALALADNLLECDGIDETDLMARFVRWKRQGDYSCNGRCFDIGATVNAALARWEATGDPIAGSTDKMSAGNGSLMRLAPVAIRYWNDRDALEDAAARQSRTTHAARESVDACVAYAGLIADAIAGQSLDTLLTPKSHRSSPAVRAVMAGSWRGKKREDIRASGYVIHSLEAALWSVGRGLDFRDAILMAANLGEDADTTAAITGQLAGAVYGYEAIPASWRTKLAWEERLGEIAARLLRQSGVELG